MENASSKVSFRLSHKDNLEVIAQWLYMGVMNPDEVKHELYSTKVMEFRDEFRMVYGEGTSTGNSHGSQQGSASGMGTGGTHMSLYDGEPQTMSDSFSEFSAESRSEAHTTSQSRSISKSFVPTLVPVLGRELSHVQFRSLEEQLFRAMAVLFDQRERL